MNLYIVAYVEENGDTYFDGDTQIFWKLEEAKEYRDKRNANYESKPFSVIEVSNPTIIS